MLGACPLHQGSCGLHDKLLLGEGHLLSAVEQTNTEIRVRLSSDGSLLPVDTIHSLDPGLLSLVIRNLKSVIDIINLYVCSLICPFVFVPTEDSQQTAGLLDYCGSVAER